MAIKNYYPISMNYLQERYQFWLEHFSHSEDKEKLAFEEAKRFPEEVNMPVVAARPKDN